MVGTIWTTANKEGEKATYVGIFVAWDTPAIGEFVVDDDTVLIKPQHKVTLQNPYYGGGSYSNGFLFLLHEQEKTATVVAVNNPAVAWGSYAVHELPMIPIPLSVYARDPFNFVGVIDVNPPQVLRYDNFGWGHLLFTATFWRRYNEVYTNSSVYLYGATTNWDTGIEVIDLDNKSSEVYYLPQRDSFPHDKHHFFYCDAQQSLFWVNVTQNTTQIFSLEFSKNATQDAGSVAAAGTVKLVLRTTLPIPDASSFHFNYDPTKGVLIFEQDSVIVLVDMASYKILKKLKSPYHVSFLAAV